MKTNLLIIGTIVLALSSCSNNDNETQTQVQNNSEYKLLTTSNTSGKVSYIDFLATTPTVKSFTIASTDADGVYYDSDKDQVILASRTNNKLEMYSALKTAITSSATALNLASSSTSDFNNPRETTISGDKIIVTQDQSAANSNTNKILVYQKFDSGLISFNKSFTVNFKIWGIQMQGTTLYAVADLTGDLVVFENFLSNASGAITPTKRITIAGLVRSHGITYSAADDKMILTDVGVATSDTDGAIIVISNFTSILNATPNGGTIAPTNQLKISGPMSTLGNPVDVAYDDVSEKIYVAERLNAGGKVLTFNSPTSNSDVTPIDTRAEAGVSSVYLVRK
ncbi:hypothetical protein OX283_011070 [Flavobacterium sp. SUN052]|uniref:hypothetical protein n=1 Tax=Flavobacterium sp. SUN052 TaxID=3002441 RepID=UPI00237E5B2A|nr:hypothetical protein [Flavobacterium sp. SUN052]MEC4005200.1 hypothetical protein [Flavobacterium sp. SUN052]